MKSILVSLFLVSAFGFVFVHHAEAASCRWNFLRNECTGCGVARSVQQNNCSGNSRISALNVKDIGCNNSEWCSSQSSCTVDFKYNECVDCNISRSVAVNSCTGAYVVGNNQNDPACSSWCQNNPSNDSCPVNSACCSNPLSHCTVNGKDPSCPANFGWCYAGFCVNENYKPETDSCSTAAISSVRGADIACSSTLDGDLKSTISRYKSASGKPVWVTEIGFGTDDRAWQAEYLSRTFNIFASQGVPVVIWYGWSDSMTGGNGLNDWGLYDIGGSIKESGIKFNSLSGL